MIQVVTKKIEALQDLSRQEMQSVMEEIMSGKAATADVVSFLTALNKKGETIDELTAAVTVMRKFATQIHSKEGVVLDVCGTGGDKKGTFNISTAVAFVVSACGITVAKHGNRSVSSCCGSADILEALGINIDMPAQIIEKCLNDIGIAFLFAQNLHPAMKYAMPARKQIGSRTMFNILGPLSNPASATHQLIGVYDANLTGKLAGVLNNLGTKHAMIVHGDDGLDEITTTAETSVSEAQQGKISNYKIRPEDFGLSRTSLADLAGGSASENAEDLFNILNGKSGAKRDIVVLNSAAALYVADKVKSIKEGMNFASEAIDSKQALKKLEDLKDYSKRQ